MADAPVNIDDSLIPGMMSLNVVEALERAASLSNEMRESTSLCSRLIERLLFVREQLQTPSDEYARHLRGLSPQDRVIIATQLANAVGLVIGVFRTYAHKTALQRVAASRLIRAVVPVLHTKIDKVFTLAGLTTVPEMTAWKTQEESDISTQRRLLEVLVRNRSAITQDLSDSLREEALMEIRHEIDSQMSPRVFVALLEEALATVVNAVGGAAIPEVPAYYVRRDDIKIGEQIDLGSFGEVHKAKWGAEETDVVVKQLYMDGAEAKAGFRKEANIWFRLNHPHVNKMLAGCPVGKPLFFVAEYAKKGNFADFFGSSEENSNKLWRLFHEAAQGLSYLHSKRIVHCDLKANNILVGNDGLAKLCDFGFSHIRSLSIGMSVKAQPVPARWKAPECLLEQGIAANPTFKSDVYSLGMTIIEVKTGNVPWGIVSDDDIIDLVGDGYPRPDGVFTDREWALIKAMTALEPKERLSLAEVTAQLAELAREEEVANATTSVKCEKCSNVNPSGNKFCGTCGTSLGGEAPAEAAQP